MLRYHPLQIIALGLVTLTVACEGDGMCGNKERLRLSSPDRSTDAVVFDRSCGATTTWSTQVALIPQGDSIPDRPANAFIHPISVELGVRWLDDARLEVDYPAGPAPIRANSPVEGVFMHYRQRAIGEPHPPVGTQTGHLDSAA